MRDNDDDSAAFCDPMHDESAMSHDMATHDDSAPQYSHSDAEMDDPGAMEFGGGNADYDSDGTAMPGASRCDPFPDDPGFVSLWHVCVFHAMLWVGVDMCT